MHPHPAKVSENQRQPVSVNTAARFFAVFALAALSACEESSDPSGKAEQSEQIQLRLYQHPNWQNLDESTRNELQNFVSGAADNLWQHFKSADEVRVISLDPRLTDSTESFHGYQILGDYVLTEPAGIEEFGQSVVAGLIPRALFQCDFAPRHAIRISSGDQHFDLLICFKCAELSARGTADSSLFNRAFFDQDVRELLDSEFEQRNIERAP